MSAKGGAKRRGLLAAAFPLLKLIQENHLLFLGLSFSFLFHSKIPFDLPSWVFGHSFFLSSRSLYGSNSDIIPNDHADETLMSPSILKIGLFFILLLVFFFNRVENIFISK